MKKYIFIFALPLFMIAACNSNTTNTSDEHDHAQHSQDSSHTEDAHGEECTGDHDHENETIPASDEIVLLPEQAKAVGVVSEVIEPKPFCNVILTSGKVQAAQGNESVIVSNVAGIVSFKQPVTAGMSVGKGTAILSVNAENMPEGDPVKRTKIAYETAKQEYDRALELVKSQIISQKEFNVIKENYENTRLSYQALAKNQNSKGVTITSPMSGYIKNCMVQEGDYVTVGQPLLSVTQTRKLYLQADVSEKYYKALNLIKSANFKTPYDNKVYELQALSGKLLSYGKSSSDSYFIPVTFEFDNQGDVVPGSFVEIYLLSSEIPNVLSLPLTAITEEQGVNFIYLQIDEEGYKKQEVTLGMNNGKEVQILTGLKAGERVVTKGAYRVRLASVSSAIPSHGHEH